MSRSPDPWVGLSGAEYTSRRSRGLAPWTPRGRSAEILDDILGQLDAERDYWPVTDRHIGYRLISHAGYDKSNDLFEDVERIIQRGRRAGLIPGEAIHDGRSATNEVPTWGTVGEFLEDVPEWYNRDLLTDQPYALEVWVEASGMVPQASSVADAFAIPVMTSAGFRTTSAIYALARRALRRFVKENGRRTAVLLLGDLDKSGIAAMDSTADDAWAFFVDMTNGRLSRRQAESVLKFDIVALTPDQADDYSLEGRPGDPTVKRGDYDGPEYQLEALDAADFAAILRGAIDRYVDHSRFDAQASLQGAQREEIRRLIASGEAT